MQVAGYGRTVSNVQGNGIPNDGSSYRKTVSRDPKSVRTRHGGRVISLSQESVRYKMGRNVSILS